MNFMLTSSSLFKNMWGEALYSACNILNIISYKGCDKTPYELWKKREHFLKHFKMWECLVKVNISLNKKRKIGIKIFNCVFISYSLNITTYRFLIFNYYMSEISNNTIMESRDAIFFENVFPSKDKWSIIVYDTSNFGLPSTDNVICDGSSFVFLQVKMLIKLFKMNLGKVKVHQMEVKIAFLNGDLEEKIYIKQLDDFIELMTLLSWGRK